MLKGIDIANYRGFKCYKMEGLAQVNLLVGKNNRGKTALAEAIHLITAGGDPLVLAEAAQRRGELAALGDAGRTTTDLTHFFYGHVLSVDSSFTLRSDNGFPTLTVRLVPIPDDPALFSEDDEELEAQPAFGVIIEGAVGFGSGSKDVRLSERGGLIISPRVRMGATTGTATGTDTATFSTTTMAVEAGSGMAAADLALTGNFTANGTVVPFQSNAGSNPFNDGNPLDDTPYVFSNTSTATDGVKFNPSTEGGLNITMASGQIQSESGYLSLEDDTGKTPDDEDYNDRQVAVTATTVQDTSMTVSDPNSGGVGYVDGTGSTPLAYTRDSGGYATFNITTTTTPAATPSNLVHMYEVDGANGEEVTWGTYTSSSTSGTVATDTAQVVLPTPAGGEADYYSVITGFSPVGGTAVTVPSFSMLAYTTGISLEGFNTDDKNSTTIQYGGATGGGTAGVLAGQNQNGHEINLVATGSTVSIVDTKYNGGALPAGVSVSISGTPSGWATDGNDYLVDFSVSVPASFHGDITVRLTVSPRPTGYDVVTPATIIIHVP